MKTKKLLGLSNDEKRKLIYFSTDPEILSELACDPDLYIRELVAKSINTPLAVLSKLANDDGWCVRLHVAKNPKTPKDVLLMLSKDPDNFIAKLAVEILNQRK